MIKEEVDGCSRRIVVNFAAMYTWGKGRQAIARRALIEIEADHLRLAEETLARTVR